MIRLRVREVATSKGFNMGKLSRASDVDRNTIKRMFDDPNYSPTLDTIDKVARVLGVKVDELYFQVEDD